MLCKISLNKISLGKGYFSPLVFGVGWQDFFHLTLFLLRETNLSSTFTKCL